MLDASGPSLEMIDLGLSRIGRLVNASQLPWRAIHVAGTNGKGSICAYTSSMLKAAGVRCGRFTSPHLIDRWDCITIDEVAVTQNLFQVVEAEICQKNEKKNIGATSFEMLTATAFEIFAKEKVQVGVVEVGMGGRLDATNVFIQPLVTLISKIGLDHQAFLGNTMAEIAREKAGIMKPGVACIVDGTNGPDVLNVLTDYASEIQAGPLTMITAEETTFPVKGVERMPLHQRINFACASKGVEVSLAALHISANSLDYIPSGLRTVWPARLQEISIAPITGRPEPVLLDGAHNSQSAEILGSYVDQNLRIQDKPVTWILAMTKGKDIKAIANHLVRPGDSVVPVRFGPVDGMPWVESSTTQDIMSAIKESKLKPTTESSIGHNLGDMLSFASRESNGGALVIAGSLYLAGDVLRLLRNASIKSN